jgi:hypothetical protein
MGLQGHWLTVGVVIVCSTHRSKFEGVGALLGGMAHVGSCRSTRRATSDLASVRAMSDYTGKL